MKTIRCAVHKENGVKRAEVMLNKDGNYCIDIYQFEKEGYYQAHKSFRVVEYTSLDCAVGFYEELLESNKLEEIY